MKRLLILPLLALVAACGADGEPVQPSATLNVGVGSGGVHAGGTIGASRGPVSIFVGF